MTRVASRWAGPCLLLLPLLALSCAPPAPPAPPPVPPASVPAPEAAAPEPQRPALPEPASGAVGRGGPERLVTVGLAWNLDSLTVDPVGAASFRGPSEGRLGPSEWMVFRRSDRGAVAQVRGGEIRQLALWPGDTLWLSGIEGEAGSPARHLRWGGRSWRGEFKIFLNARGKLTVASRLPLETYLLGVLPGEIGRLAEDLIEAGRAQAIAARSYTLFYRGRRGAEGFDLYGTVEDQVYGSVESEWPIPTFCVTSTAGEVAMSQGQPIRANYSSTCGGITADVWEAWPTPPMPYLVSHRDREHDVDFCASSPHHRWREEWPAQEFLSSLRRFGPEHGVRLPAGGPGELIDVRVASRSRSGRVWSLVVTTTRGEIVVPAHSLRRVLRRPGNPDAILRSTLFKVAVRRDPATRRASSVVASGAGSGHGVGLCQTGALGMARLGKKGEEIIRHYFPNVEIRSFDPSRVEGETSAPGVR